MIRFPQFKGNFLSSGEEVLKLRSDIREVKTCFEGRAYKATMVLCGSILEDILLERLSVDPYLAGQGFLQVFNKMPPVSFDGWKLEQLLRVSDFLGLISHETYQLGDLLRNYRNLIHPGAIKRTLAKPDEDRATRAIDAAKQAIVNIDQSFSSIWRTVYIININGIPGRFINSPNNIQTAVNTIALQHGLNVQVISTFTQLQALLQTPTPYSIVVNTHGEIMPVPPQISWTDHYRALNTAVSSAGWILVNIGGYPFYYGSANQHIARAGLDTFLAPSHITADCMTATTATFTEQGRAVLQSMNMGLILQTFVVPRSASWDNVSQKIVFLNRGSLSGLSAIRMGRGWFLNFGVDSTSPNAPQALTQDHVVANMAIGCSLYVADRL